MNPKPPSCASARFPVPQTASENTLLFRTPLPFTGVASRLKPSHTMVPAKQKPRASQVW